MNSRQLKALETKNSLYVSALRLFKEKGYENVYVEDIADMAGTSKGSFYTYFKSKDDVVLEHYNKIDDSYENAFKGLDSSKPYLTQLLFVLQAGFQFCDDLGYEFLSIVLSNQLSPSESSSLVIQKDRKLYKITKTIITQGQTAGEFHDKYDTEFLLDVCLTFYRGLFLDYCFMKNSDIKLSSYGEERLQLFIKKVLFK